MELWANDQEVSADSYSTVFTWDWKSGNNFFKQFFAGMFTTLVMVGMDQDMMQKNLTCKNKREAQKICWCSVWHSW